MPFTDFIDAAEGPERTLLVANRESPRALAGMLEDLFVDKPVAVTEADLPDADVDQVLLIADGEVVATSPLSALADAILLVNSDLFMTGSRDLTDVELPDVLAGLEEIPFTLQGYPESNVEKLLLTVVSRHIERLAYDHGVGRLRASFQRLSRIDDEQGTREVYRLLADTDVAVHLYGVPDWLPSEGFDGVVHGGWTDQFRRNWFVIFRPPDADHRGTLGGDADGPTAGGGDAAALVAREIKPRRWRGLWTTDGERVAAVERFVERRF